MITLRFLSSHVALAALALLTAPGHAQEDRERTDPVRTHFGEGMTASQITTWVNLGYRITDLEIDGTSPLTFTVSMVANTGSFAKAWWWYPDVDGTTLGNFLAANPARIVDLEPFEQNGQTRFAVVMIRNTGVDAKGWWWLYDTNTATIANFVSQNNARIVDLERYWRNGTWAYGAVLIPNTGADARAWSWHLDVDVAYINHQVDTYHLRPYDLERRSNGRYDVVLTNDTPGAWWHAYGLTRQGLDELLSETGGRVSDVEVHTSLGVRRFNVLLLDATQPLTRRVRNAMTSQSNGRNGHYLREIDGTLRSALLDRFVFEPASLIKTLYHVHAVHEILIGNASFGENVTVYESCPNYANPVVESLEVVLRKMMENSDNYRTRAVADRFGKAAINQTAAILGMSQTRLNHDVGCTPGTGPNELTLYDLYKLHAAVANGYLGSLREPFYALMANGTFPIWSSKTLVTLIQEEAAALGLPGHVAGAFQNRCFVAFKPGGYTVNNVQYHSLGGFLRLPFKSASGVVTDREYVIGTFNHGGSDLSASRRAVGEGMSELLRDELRAALRTWDTYVAGRASSFGSGCAGTAGTPNHTVGGTPDTGWTMDCRLTGAPPQTPIALILGVSRTFWNAVPLPLSLTLFGAPSCHLYVSMDVTLSRTANSLGRQSVGFLVPNVPELIGASLHSQFLVLDPTANTLGVTTTNGVTTTIGGWR